MRSHAGCEAKLSCKTLTQGVIMDKTDAIGLGIIGLIAVIGLSCVAIKRENRTIEQTENLSVLCAKAYKSELKNDQKVQEICRDVQIKLFDEEDKL